MKEIHKDLFKMECPLAHCISSDFAMGAGIALNFRRMGVEKQLKKNFKKNNWNGTGYCLRAMADNGHVVYNLVTKQYYYMKPNYNTLTSALVDMKRQLIENGETEIAMPMIGCGLDKLRWNKVKNIIETIFNDTDINVTICYK